MTETPRWFDRKFEFDFPTERYPVIVERLHGLLPRLEHRLHGVDPTTLRRRDGDTWSILENAGHLVDLEPLWLGRFEAFARGSLNLAPADLANRRTEQAGHNDRTAGEIVMALRRERGRLLALLAGWDVADFGRVAIHPRLRRPMRAVDLALFVAEHDDHHLARIAELRRAPSR